MKPEGRNAGHCGLPYFPQVEEYKRAEEQRKSESWKALVRLLTTLLCVGVSFGARGPLPKVVRPCEHVLSMFAIAVAGVLSNLTCPVKSESAGRTLQQLLAGRIAVMEQEIGLVGVRWLRQWLLDREWYSWIFAGSDSGCWAKNGTRGFFCREVSKRVRGLRGPQAS